MSWFDEDWSYRMLLCGHNTGITAPDCDVVLSPSHAHFWANVESDGHDVRFARGEGRNSINYDRQAWDYANQAATFEFGDGTTLFPDPATEGMEIISLYYGNAAAADIASGFVPVVDFDFLAYPADPRSDPSKIVLWRPPERGTTEPIAVVTKTSTEAIIIWFDITDALQRADVPFEGSISLEQVKHFWYDVTDASVSQAAMFDFSLAQVYETDFGAGGMGRTLLGCYVKAGSAGTDYLVQCLFYTAFYTSGDSRRVLDARCVLKVQDPAD